MLRLVSSPLTPCAEPAIQEQWKETLGSAIDHSFLCCPLQPSSCYKILLSSTTCLVLGPSSSADTTRAATPAKEQEHQLSRSVTSLILSSIPRASLWSMVLLSFCECTDDKGLIPRKQGKASGDPHSTRLWVPVSPHQPDTAQDL